MADFLILDNEKKNDNVNNVYNRKKSWFFWQIGELFYSFQKIRTKEKIQLYRLLSTMLNAYSRKSCLSSRKTTKKGNL